MSYITPILTAILALTLDIVTVLHLGHDDWSVRENADKRLRGRGYAARPALEVGCQSKDSEVRRRSESLRSLAVGNLIDTFPPVEIDAAWWDREAQEYAARKYPERYARLSPYLDAVGRDPPPWHNYYEATRLWLRAELEAGTSETELRQLMREMEVNDRQFLWLWWHSH